MPVLFILGGIIGYLFGSANSSLIVGKFHGIDIRKHGSGNAGTTNTLRTLGKKATLYVIIGDLLKGVLAYLAGYYLTGSVLGGMISGTAAIIGHVWPVYFGFKGGKGVLTTLAVVLMIHWQLALSLLGVFIIIVAITRYVSLGSVIAAILLPITSAVMGQDTEHIIFCAIIAILIVFMHRKNIDRLLKGTESKLSFKKKE
jgi:acyl-phosphate glycerol 3-phosphate acyltransferase